MWDGMQAGPPHQVVVLLDNRGLQHLVWSWFRRDLCTKIVLEWGKPPLYKSGEKCHVFVGAAGDVLGARWNPMRGQGN